MKLHSQRPTVLLAALFLVLLMPSVRAQSVADVMVGGARSQAGLTVAVG